MNCSLDSVSWWIWGTIALLLAAMALAWFWVAAIPLFVAAGLVATAVYVFFPGIKNALLAYAACRGPSDKCTISANINTLGSAAAVLSAIAFLAAGLLELTALAFISSWILAWLGVSLQAAVAYLVDSGEVACAIVILVLLGVLSNAYAYKSCMDTQTSTGPGAGSTGGAIP